MSPAPNPRLQMPMTLELAHPDGTARVTCVRVVRAVTGRRYVYEGSCNGQAVYVKLFVDRWRARRHWRREHAGIRVLAAAGIPTPSLRYAGFLAAERAYALITDAIPAAKTMEEACNRAAESEQALALLEQAVGVLATQHAAGMLHRDLHLNNFLVAGEAVYSVDASGIRLRGRPLARRTSVRNLGTFLGQFFPPFDRYAPQLLRCYARVRGWEPSAQDLADLQAQIVRTRSARKRAFLRRIFGAGSGFARARENGYVIVRNRAYDTQPWRDALRDPERAFRAADSTYLKRGNTATVARARIAGKSVVIKRYNLKGAWHACKRALRRTRASISWENAHLLRFYGIPTPAPVAVVERRIGPIRRTSYFFSEYVEGPNCRDYFTGESTSEQEKARIAERITDILSTLARHRLRHGDLKATNLIVSNGRVYLVDLDALRAYRRDRRFRRGFQQDVERLRRNWADQPEVWRFFERALRSWQAKSEISILPAEPMR